jgi:uncharacterized protein (DUF58 family)
MAAMKTMKAQHTRDVARAVRRVDSRARTFVDAHVAGRGREGCARLLMVDLSATGYFGTKRARKRDVAAEAAAILGLAAVREDEAVGALLFTDRIELFLPPRKGRAAVLRIVREILFREPKGRGADLCLALDQASRLLKRRALAFLVSDFLLPGRIAAEFLRLTRTIKAAKLRHEVVALSVSDPRELELPNLGRITLEDAETGEKIEIDTSSEATRASYRAAAERYRLLIARCLRLGGVDRIDLSTARPDMPALVTFLGNRRARRAS